MEVWWAGQIRPDGRRKMHVTGRCFCGDVQYEAEVNEKQVGICHCTSCQRNSGTAFRVTVYGDGENFRLISGELSTFEHVADSGATRSRAFCPKCGTHIYVRSIGGGGIPMWGFRVGTIDQRDKLVPNAQGWCRSAQPWAIIESLPQIATQLGAEEIARRMAK